jgi:hypothetical protein
MLLKQKLKIDNKLNVTFEFNAGIKQGDGLSAVVFTVTLHSVIKDSDQRGTIYTKKAKYVHIETRLL